MNIRLCLFGVIAVVNLISCSILDSVRSPSSNYRSFVEDHVEEARLFDRGRELLSVKALMAGEELMKRQETLTPGFHFPFDAESDQIIIALDFSTWERFSANDLKISLQSVPSKKILELSNPTQNEIHYPFAHPHYRVFCVSFEKQPLQNFYDLQVQTLRGELKLRLKN